MSARVYNVPCAYALTDDTRDSRDHLFFSERLWCRRAMLLNEPTTRRVCRRRRTQMRADMCSFAHSPLRGAQHRFPLTKPHIAHTRDGRRRHIAPYILPAPCRYAKVLSQNRRAAR